MTYSIQLYSARNFPPLDAQLGRIAGLGYTDVEPFRGLYDDVEGLARGLEANRLSARSGHFSLELLETDFDGSMRIAKRIGNEILVLPYLVPDERPSDVDGWQRMAKRIAGLAGRVRAAGYRVAWHNHDFEMHALSDGRCPLEIILDAEPALEWEADLAWVVRGGADPLSWLRRYAGRVSALHVKDIAPAGANAHEDGWADVGAGTLDWNSLWKAGRDAGADLFIAEHDNPSDFGRFASASMAAMRRFAGEK